MDTFYGTRIHCVLDTFLRAAFGHDHFGFFLFRVEVENFRAELYTAFAADTFIGINIYQSLHIEGSLAFQIVPLIMYSGEQKVK